MLVLLSWKAAIAQVENVPVGHPVYDFLKRMEVKGLIHHYHDEVLPLSRKDVARLLADLNSLSPTLTSAERGYLDDFLSEFHYDISRDMEGFHSLIDSEDPTFGESIVHIFSNKEKYLYAYSDSNLSFFVNGILALDGRGITGDALGKTDAEYVQFGGRIRGTIYGKLGYYVQGLNAQFWGSRDLLLRDRYISQTHTIRVTDTRNFDMSDGYLRYDGGIVSAQVGMERLLWGSGYEQQLIVSDNVRPFPFIRMDAEYKSLKYTFIHGWLLGSSGTLTYSLPSDSSTVFVEPTNADKYIAAHRLEFSFPGLFDIGAQEIMIYSNRSVDLAYLTPIIVLESAQRARGERDNAFWAFDVQTHFASGIELTASLMMDDIHFGEFFKNKWYNRNAYQVGALLTDPLFFPDMNVTVQWTRVEPYMFAHDRSRDDNYSSLGRILGPDIGPNADAWFFRVAYFPLRNLKLSLDVRFVRKGDNIVDPATGQLIKNVGGDFLQPHRPSDPEERTFLDGMLVKTRTARFLTTYEVRNQIWLDGWVDYESIRNVYFDSRSTNTAFGARIRLEF